MSTAPVIVADDSVVEKPQDETRSASWWHLPASLTVLGLIALILFGLRGLPGTESTFALARETDLNPLGLVPERITVPPSSPRSSSPSWRSPPPRACGRSRRCVPARRGRCASPSSPCSPWPGCWRS